VLAVWEVLGRPGPSVVGYLHRATAHLDEADKGDAFADIYRSLAAALQSANARMVRAARPTT